MIRPNDASTTMAMRTSTIEELCVDLAEEFELSSLGLADPGGFEALMYELAKSGFISVFCRRLTGVDYFRNATT